MNEPMISDAARIRDNLRHLRERIETACARSGRRPETVKLLLATKTVPAERLRAAVDAGERLFGENKAQELREKQPALADAPVEWHFIGHLQTNKVKDVIPYVTMIHSVDRLSLAEALHKRLSRDGKAMDVLIQVNTSEEPSKFGVRPEEAPMLIEQVAAFPTLRIKGLMTIGKLSADPKDARRCFRLLREIRDRARDLRLPGVEMAELSMGMSGDLEIAIEEGATIVRVGTAVFGERKYPDSYYWREGK
ncbi:MAG: YggS family pyridoxal phosphate-dependent enzyme [Hydrogenibacillus sp.]|nr:YggS family pyridoxal phosphate-dependent enzyme [Hydrogenibacillus sp.]